MMKTLLSAIVLLLSSAAQVVAASPDAYDARRAGCPQCVHRFARPSYSPHYSGGYVGGGAVVGGEGPYAHEGTWGLDYSGLLRLKRIWLPWSHHHYQAGGGKYDTDH